MVCLVLVGLAFYHVECIDIINNDRFVETLLVVDMDIDIKPVKVP